MPDFINFAGVPKGGFVGIVKQANYDAIVKALGKDLTATLVGKTVELRGEIALYKEAPQIVLTSAEQIKVLEQ